MGRITVSVKGALAYTLRDLMVLEGKEPDWNLIGQMVDKELWPRMCQWMGVNPNYAPNYAQGHYDEQELAEYMVSDKILPLSWEFDNGGYNRLVDGPISEPEHQEIEGQTTITISPEFQKWLEDREKHKPSDEDGEK